MLLNKNQIDWLFEKCGKYNRKAAKLNQSFVKVVVGEFFDLEKEMEKWTNFPLTYEQVMNWPADEAIFDGVTINVAALRNPRWNVTLEGELPVIFGYKILGRVDKFVGDTNIISEVPGENIPEYYQTAKMDCDHCGFSRNRNSIVVLQESRTGKIIQVGTNCVADYIRDKSSEKLIDLALIWAEFYKVSSLDEDDYKPRKKTHLMLSDFLGHVSMAIRLYGYRKTSEGSDATINVALTSYGSTSEKAPRPSADDFRKAEEAIAYVRSLKREDVSHSNFICNLWTISQSSWVPLKHLSVACFIPEFVRREHQKKIQQEVALEQVQSTVEPYLGKVGEEIYFVGTLVTVNVVPSMFTNATYLYKFIEEDGREVVWFTNRDHNFEEGKRFIVSGTVKAHQKYKEKCSTKITRAKVRLFGLSKVC